MADAYVTLNEAAELEGTTYATMQRRVHRNPEKFLIDKEQRETGGKEMIMVAISSLSKKARTAWKEREKLKAVAEAPVQEADQAGETPWYVEEDIDWYIENRKEDWYKAMELGNIVREFLEYDERGRTEFAETFAQSFLKNGLNGCMKYMKSKRMEHLRSRENNSRHRRAASKILRNISKHVRRRAMQLF